MTVKDQDSKNTRMVLQIPNNTSGGLGARTSTEGPQVKVVALKRGKTVSVMLPAFVSGRSMSASWSKFTNASKSKSANASKNKSANARRQQHQQQRKQTNKDKTQTDK